MTLRGDHLAQPNRHHGCIDSRLVFRDSRCITEVCWFDGVGEDALMWGSISNIAMLPLDDVVKVEGEA